MNMKIKLKKRGLTTVAATILLISFALALGIVILNFGQSLIHDVSAEPVKIEGKTLCPAGCVAEDLFTNSESPLVKEIRGEFV